MTAEDTFFGDFEYVEMPGHHPYEDDLGKLGACTAPALPTQWWTDLAPANRGNNRKAKVICEGCPVMGKCRTVADSWDEVLEAPSILGGETPSERRRRRAGVS